MRKDSLNGFYLVSAVLSAGYGSVLTLLADFRDEYGFSDLGISALGSAGFVTGFLSQLFLAKYADRGFGQKMVRFGLIADLAALLWMASTDNVWQFVAARALLGVGSGVCGPAISKIIITRNPDNSGVSLGKSASWGITGFTLGPLLTAVVADFTNLRIPFVLIAGLYAVASLRVWNEDYTCPVGVAPKHKGVIRQLLSNKRVLSGLWVSVAVSAALGVFATTWALLLSDAGAPTWLIGASRLVYTLPLILLAPLAGRVAGTA